MNLKHDVWTKENIDEFQHYLLSLSKGKEKSEWEQRIINTSLPCIAVPAPEVKRIINEIAKGNFISFIDLWPWENFTNTSIVGGLITKIKDFDTFKKYLAIYSNKCDNWATCDILKFNIKKDNKAEYFNISKEYAKSPLPFVRRIGMTILFKLVDDDEYIYQIFDLLNSFGNEENYYVNMVNAWLIAECLIKQHNKTFEFLKNNNLNKFTINKAISKCHDSFRVSPEDKETIKDFRR